VACPPGSYSTMGVTIDGLVLFCILFIHFFFFYSGKVFSRIIPFPHSSSGDCQPCPIGRVALKANTTECEPCSNTSYAANNTCLPCKDAERQTAKGDACELIPGRLLCWNFLKTFMLLLFLSLFF
jgi:hypothetical protein